jgi:serine/threonine-protein kinase
MFGRYELRALLGAGGMGEVYRAYDTVKDRTVALKLLRREFAADDQYQHRFRRESKLAARLQEPHVIPVHDRGEINGVPYLEMRLVEGRSVGAHSCEPKGASTPHEPLPSWIRSRRRSTPRMPPACSTATLNPTTFCSPPATSPPWLTSGIAHIGGETTLTSAGSAIGFFAYTAPERFKGTTGPEADVYSLACLLYECLTGQTRFRLVM